MKIALFLVRPQSVKILRKETYLTEGQKVHIVCEVRNIFPIDEIVKLENNHIGGCGQLCHEALGRIYEGEIQISKLIELLSSYHWLEIIELKLVSIHILP